MRIVIPALLICFTLFSCVSVRTGSDKPDPLKLESENHIIRKRLVAVERRNNILETENIKYRKDSRDLKSTIENLRAEIKTQIEKHQSDERMWTQRYDNIMKKNAILEKESSEKIRELTDLNKKIESDLGLQIKQLGEEMAKKEKAASKILADEQRAASAREFDLSTQVEKHKKDITKLDETIIALEEKNKLRDAKILALEEDAKKNSAALKASGESIAAGEREIARLKNAAAALEQKIKDIEAENAKLKAQPAPEIK